MKLSGVSRRLAPARVRRGLFFLGNHLRVSELLWCGRRESLPRAGLWTLKARLYRGGAFSNSYDRMRQPRLARRKSLTGARYDTVWRSFFCSLTLWRLQAFQQCSFQWLSPESARHAAINVSLGFPPGTTRATGGAMRESFPARSRCPFSPRAFPVRGGCWAEPPILCPRNVLALASGPAPFLI